jgi:hypothetical protein
MFVFVAPESTWQPQDLFTVLLCLGFVSFAAAVHLRANVTFDAGFVIALLALVYLGPLPATLVFSAPELGRWLGGHTFPRLLSNVATFGWSVLAATFVLEALNSSPPVQLDDAGAYAAVAAAGLVLILVNYLFGAIFGGVLRDGIRLPVLVRQELVPTLPVDLALLALSLVTILLYEEIGIEGLVPLAAMIVLPRLVMPMVLRRRAVSQLPRVEATSMYAQAIADELGLGGSSKRVLADAATHFGGSARLTRIEDFQPVMRAVLYCKEPWDGAGGTDGMETGDDIPLESRILAVSNAWSDLTATGTNELSPKDALHHLKARSGRELDPKVVAAAVRVVENETLPAGH